MTDFAAARLNMVLSQLEPNRVTDAAVVAAMSEVPRERFVPEGLAGVAYVDEDIQVAPGRYLMEPMVFARLLQAAAPRPQELVLDLGCATGYSAAVLAKLTATVVAMESDDELAARATETLAALAIDNAAVITGALAEGRADQGPYDLIVIEGSVPDVPGALADQLAEGGRLVAVIGAGPMGKATLVERGDAVLSRRVLFDAATPPLPGFDTAPAFTF